MKRIKDRSRGEEHLISEAYVRDLHHLHEKWLVEKKEYVPAPVLVVNADNDIGDMAKVFQDICDRVLNKESTSSEDSVVVEKTLEDDFKENDTISREKNQPLATQKVHKRSSILTEIN